MRVLLIIDHFGSGGAQRQMVELACGLADRGHQVEMFIYHPEHDFFRGRLTQRRIVIHEASKNRGFSLNLVRKLRSVMRSDFDVAVAYQNSANLYAELAKGPWGGVPLIVSERTSHLDDRSRLAAVGRRLLHGLADHVVANSHTQRDWLARHSWLRGKVSCIYNGIRVDEFQSAPLVPTADEDIRLLAIGRVGPEKNILNMVRGLQRLEDTAGYVPYVDWVGPRDLDADQHAYSLEVDKLLSETPAVRRRWQWLGVQADIPGVFRRHHALILPSFYEGLPNVVCEAFAAARPVLVSNVCDHPRLVANGKRGLLFDPTDPVSIAGSISQLRELDETEWRAMSTEARRYAVNSLGVDRMVDAYEALFREVVTQHVGSA